MSFISQESDKEFPLLWNVESLSSGGKIVMEIQDEMKKKGVSKRVLFNNNDSTWTMLMSFNKVKQGTRIKANAMYRDTMKHRKISTKMTKEKKIIQGYNCNKMIVESEKYFADVWTTNEIKFDLCRVYRLLSHCGMMNKSISNGDWFMVKSLKNIVMEVTSKNKSTGMTYTMMVTELKPNVTDTSQFASKGFLISDIPEGQSCGPMEKVE
jgi:hypothetical protein